MEKWLIWVLRVWLKFFCRQALTLEKCRIPWSILAAYNHRNSKSPFFLSDPLTVPWGSHLKSLSGLWCLHGLWEQCALTASHRMLLVTTVADPAVSRSSPKFLVLSSCSEVMERRFPWKDLGSWRCRIKTSLPHPRQNCSRFTAIGAPSVLTSACKTHSSALVQVWFHVQKEVLLKMISAADEDLSMVSLFLLPTHSSCSWNICS